MFKRLILDSPGLMDNLGSNEAHLFAVIENELAFVPRDLASHRSAALEIAFEQR